MSIDWFTVGAQILNFLILVWLLKRFLYQPILDAIDAREQRIANELENADTIQRKAQQERDEFAQKNAEFDQQKQTLLQQAKDAADTERASLIAAARKQADALGVKLQQASERQQQSIHTELRSLARDEVFAISRKVLTDLAGADLELSIVAAFIAKLQTIDGDAKQAFVNALSGSGLSSDNQPQIQVCSAFELKPTQKTAITVAIHSLFAAKVALQFDLDAYLISGIKLSVNGQQISWSIDEYLGTLKNSVEALLQAADDKSAATISANAAIAP